MQPEQGMFELFIRDISCGYCGRLNLAIAGVGVDGSMHSIPWHGIQWWYCLECWEWWQTLEDEWEVRWIPCCVLLAKRALGKVRHHV